MAKVGSKMHEKPVWMSKNPCIYDDPHYPDPSIPIAMFYIWTYSGYMA